MHPPRQRPLQLGWRIIVSSIYHQRIIMHQTHNPLPPTRPHAPLSPPSNKRTANTKAKAKPSRYSWLPPSHPKTRSVEHPSQRYKTWLTMQHAPTICKIHNGFPIMRKQALAKIHGRLVFAFSLREKSRWLEGRTLMVVREWTYIIDGKVSGLLLQVFCLRHRTQFVGGAIFLPASHFVPKCCLSSSLPLHLC